MGAEGNNLMGFDAAAGVEEQHREAFAFGVEIGVGGHVQAPIVGGFLRGVAKLQGFRRGAFAERDNLILVGLRVEFEGLNKLVQTGQSWLRGDIHKMLKGEIVKVEMATSPQPSPPEAERAGKGDRSCGDAVGGEIGCVFLAGVLLAAGKGSAPDWPPTARVLPTPAGVIPMEAKLREVGAKLFNRLLGEGYPNPFANYFGEFVGAGYPLAESVEDFINRELAVAVAFLEIHVGAGGTNHLTQPSPLSGEGIAFGVRCRWRLAVVVSAQLLGSALEL